MTDSLQQLILHQDFLRREKWRTRLIQDNTMEDGLNIDWFQPFQRTNYSVGAIYLAVQNLPREDLFF